MATWSGEFPSVKFAKFSFWWNVSFAVLALLLIPWYIFMAVAPYLYIIPVALFLYCVWKAYGAHDWRRKFGDKRG